MDQASWKYRVNTNIIFPIILIGIGVLFLLNNLGILTGEIWENLLKLWPIVLIAIGIDGILKQESLTFSSVMTVLGIVFLFSNYGRLPFHVWEVLLRLWPIVLIAIGFDLVIGHRSKIISFISMLVISGLLVVILWFLGIQSENQQIGKGAMISQAVPLQEVTSLTIKPGAGSMRIIATDLGEQLLVGQVPTSASHRVSTINVNGNDVIDYNVSGNLTTMIAPSRLDEFSWDLQVNREVPMVLNVNLMAGEAQANLKDANLQGMNMEFGIGKAVVELPRAGSFKGIINSTIGDLVVIVPDGMGVMIKQNTLLAQIKVPDDYVLNDGVYYSPGYEENAEQIELLVSQAIGRISVKSE